MRDLELELEAELEDLMAMLSESDLESESQIAAPACDSAGLPVPSPKVIGLSGGKVQCPTHSGTAVLGLVVRNAVQMLDNTLAELTRARQAACQGMPLGWPNLSDITACWLKYKLGVCIDDPSAWTAGTFKSKTVAEVIRRLVRARNLLAGNEILYVCEGACEADVNAWTKAHKDGKCIPGTPDRIIHLCPRFWDDAHAPFREQIIIHEAVHLTHCAEHRDDAVGVSIGSAECLAQFVAATNGRKLSPGTIGQCGFTNRCGAIPADAMRRNCGGVSGSFAQPPDWRP